MNYLAISLTAAAAPLTVLTPPCAHAQGLIWDTARHQHATPGSTHPSQGPVSAGSVIANSEVADDFLAQGTIERIVAHGTFEAAENAEVLGAVVRFYAWTPGGPGALENETTLCAGTSGLTIDSEDAGSFHITLPTPFAADGWHFLSIQALMASGTWRPAESLMEGTACTPVHSSAYHRDPMADDAWVPHESRAPRGRCDMRFELYGAAVPIIESVTSTDTATPSGRIIVRGSALGGSAHESTLLIDGREAIVTQRLGQELRAYIPEATSLGTVSVQVTTPQGASQLKPLQVTARASNGRIRWRFQTDRWMGQKQNMKVGPDGTIYTSDELGLYAVDPNGALLWFLPGAGGGYAIDVGPDGTIYTGVVLDASMPCRIYAVNPDGTIRWTFDGPQDSNGTYYLQNGPNVGPDGNLYATQNKLAAGDAGLGMFSLDPNGTLRWSDAGDPLFRSLSSASNDAEILFTADRLYSGFDTGFAGFPHTVAYDLDGSPLWTTAESGLNVSIGSHPRIDPFGRVIGQRGQTGLISFEQDGTTRFSVVSPQQQNLIMPAVDGVGNVYTSGQFTAGLWSVDPDGDTRWYRSDVTTGIGDSVGVAPGDGTLIVGLGNFGASDWIQGHDPTNGDLVWEVFLEDELGVTQGLRNRYPVFASDGRTSYHTTSFNNVSVIPYGYLYAINLDETPGCLGSTYCDAIPSSNGLPAELCGAGSASVAANDLILASSAMPPGTLGYFLTSRTQGFVSMPAGSTGNLCLGGDIGRYVNNVLSTGTTGEFSLAINLAQIPTPTGPVVATAGETWNFQVWFRDAVLGFPTSNFSNGLAVTLN